MEALAEVAVIPVCCTKVRGVTHARKSYVGPSKRGEVLVALIIHSSLTCSHRGTNASQNVAPCILCAAQFCPCLAAPYALCEEFCCTEFRCLGCASLLIDERSRILADGPKVFFAASRNRAVDRDVHSLAAEKHRLLAICSCNAGLWYSWTVQLSFASNRLPRYTRSDRLSHNPLGNRPLTISPVASRCSWLFCKR
jgi:hypothetical protein